MAALVPFRYEPVKRARAGSARGKPSAGGYCTDMVTMAARRPYRLYIAEWMEERGLSDEKLAEKLGVVRETVTRYREQQHRLNTPKIAQVATALDIEPEELWRPPPKPNQDEDRPSLDRLLKDAPDDLVKEAAEMAAILLRRSARAS